MLGFILAQTPSTPGGADLSGGDLAMRFGAVLGLTVITFVLLFAFFRHIGSQGVMSESLESWMKLNPRPDSVREVIDELMTRRYEFLTFYGQFILSGFVVALVSMLLLTNTITSEAGLPILTAVIGFALGKTVLSRRPIQERPEQDAALRAQVNGTALTLQTGAEAGDDAPPTERQPAGAEAGDDAKAPPTEREPT
jgi:hypothetical protein